MESFLTAVSDLIPALQKHRAKFRKGSTKRSKIYLTWHITYTSILYDSILYDSYTINFIYDMSSR